MMLRIGLWAKFTDAKCPQVLRTFSLRLYPIPPDVLVRKAYHFYFHYPTLPRQTLRKHLLTPLPAVNPPGLVPWYGIGKPLTSRVHLPASQSSLQFSTAYNLDGDADFAHASWLPYDNKDEIPSDLGFRDAALRRVRGDDDFVVLFGDFGFVVWCFDEDVKLRAKDSVRR